MTDPVPKVVRPTRPPKAWAEDMFTFGVTGTNGKTSTVWLLERAVAAAGHPAIRISTAGDTYDGKPAERPGGKHQFLRMMWEGHELGCKHVVLEATSLALANHYAKFWRFDLGVFTNLSPDHFRTHGSWEAYLAAKAQLFTLLGPGRWAVLNAYDEHAVMLDQAIPADVQRLWFGSPTRGPRHHAAGLEAAEVDGDLSGACGRLVSSPRAEALGGAIETRLLGEVFAENALAAAGAALAADLDGAAVARGIASCPPVPGRFEVIAREPTVVVDYAHSTDALRRTLSMARRVTRGRLIAVFGAGGKSTPRKRAPMGAAAGELCDEVILTSDNPRGEEPGAIAAMIADGVRSAGMEPLIELDRRRAIERAIQGAGVGDVVVVAGKGHEEGQDFGDRVEPFSDREEVRRICLGEAEAQREEATP